MSTELKYIRMEKKSVGEKKRGRRHTASSREKEGRRDQEKRGNIYNKRENAARGRKGVLLRIRSCHSILFAFNTSQAMFSRQR